MWQFIASTFDHLALFVSTAIFRTASIVLLFVYLPWGVAIGWPAFFLANLMCGYQRYYINIRFYISFGEIKLLECCREAINGGMLLFQVANRQRATLAYNLHITVFPRLFPKSYYWRKVKMAILKIYLSNFDSIVIQI